MSGHGQHENHADHSVHADHNDAATSDDFPADEPRSPGWLPLLGGALLLAGVFGYMALSSDDKPDDAGPSAPAAEAPAAPQPGSARRPALAVPPGAGAPSNRARPAAD